MSESPEIAGRLASNCRQCIVEKTGITNADARMLVVDLRI
jgi:hypothetical protein